MTVDEVFDELRRRYPDEPFLYSFRAHLSDIVAGGLPAAVAAVDRHIEWKAKMDPFRDEIAARDAELVGLREQLEHWRRMAGEADDKLMSERQNHRDAWGRFNNESMLTTLGLREQLARQAAVIEAAVALDAVGERTGWWKGMSAPSQPGFLFDLHRAVRALSVPAPPKVCATCGGYPVAYKQFRVGDRFWTKDCPDCAVPAPPEATEVTG